MTPSDEPRLVALADLATRLRAASTRSDVRAAVVATAAPATGLARADLVDPAEAAAAPHSATAPLHDLKGEVIAAVVLDAGDDGHVDAATQAAVEVVADLCGTAIRRIHLADRAGALAALGASLAGAASTVEVAAALSEHGRAPLGASMLNCRVLDATGRSLVSLLDRSSLPEDLQQRYASVPLDLPSPLSDAVRRNEPVWVADEDDLAARYPSIVDDAAAAGFRAMAAVPLHDSEGEAVGALAMAWSSAIRFDPLITSSILTIGDLATQALERARMTDRRVRQARALSRLAAELTAAASRSQVAAAIAKHVPDVTGAAWARLDDNGAPEGEPADVVEADETLRVGALLVGWDRPPRPDDVLVARLRTISDLLVPTLERADLHDSEHELVTALQHRLLGTVVGPGSAQVACRYLPASRNVGIGGDWFDIVDAGDGRFTVVVGDVTGHGVDAVTAMAQLRTMINGLLRAGEPLATVFERVDAMVDTRDRLLASAELFEVDPAAGTLRYSSAGHPWALLRRAAGDVVLLDGSQRSLLGAPTRNVAPATVALRPGDVLVAYTDGLVERRGESITTGIDRLLAVLGDVPATVGLDALADALLRASGVDLDDPSLEDDVALVVLRLA